MLIGNGGLGATANKFTTKKNQFHPDIYANKNLDKNKDGWAKKELIHSFQEQGRKSNLKNKQSKKRKERTGNPTIWKIKAKNKKREREQVQVTEYF